MADTVSIEVQVNSTPTISVSNPVSPSVVVEQGSTASITATSVDVPSVSVSSGSGHSIVVSSASSPGVEVSVDPSPGIQVLNTSGMTVGSLTDVAGTPSDGQTIIYDASTNTFYFGDVSTSGTGGSGALSSPIEVTNTSNVLADSAGSTYAEGESVETVIRDILAPDDAGIEFYDLEITSGNGALTGEYIVYGTSWQVTSLKVRLERNERIPPGSKIQLFLSGNESPLLQSNAYADWSEQNEVNFGATGAFGWTTSTQYLEVRIPKFAGGYSSKRIYPKKVFPVALYVSNVADAAALGTADAVEILRSTSGFDYDGGHESRAKSALLRGSEYSEGSSNFCYVAIPENFSLESIAEVSSGVGVADMSSSFTKVSDEVFRTFHSFPGVDEYNVYLYRSNQTGALKSTSYLRVKVQ
jgi:hypothetical protein